MVAPMSTHPLDQAVFGSVLSEDVDWEPFPSFPPSARLAVVVVGDPAQPAPYVVRVKLPADVKLMAFGPISLEYLNPGDDPRNK